MPNKQELIHIARSTLAMLIAVSPFVPALVGHYGLSTTAGAGGIAVAISAGIVRLTQIEPVNARLKAWLKY